MISRVSIDDVCKVDFISSPIKRFTKTGVETEDGKHQELDLVFCATGLQFPSPIFPHTVN